MVSFLSTRKSTSMWRLYFCKTDQTSEHHWLTNTIHLTLNILFRLLKHQSPRKVLFRSTLTWTIGDHRIWTTLYTVFCKRPLQWNIFFVCLFLALYIETKQTCLINLKKNSCMPCVPMFSMFVLGQMVYIVLISVGNINCVWAWVAFVLNGEILTEMQWLNGQGIIYSCNLHRKTSMYGQALARGLWELLSKYISLPWWKIDLSYYTVPFCLADVHLLNV